jgi:hypothetical protein
VHRHRLHMHMHYWKEPFNTFHLNLFPIFIIKLISSLFSIGHYRSFSAVAILFMLVMPKKSMIYKRIKNAKKSIELWTNPKQTGHNSLVQPKGTKTVYINSTRIILKYTTNICFLEMGIFCCNSAQGFHGISACE